MKKRRIRPGKYCANNIPDWLNFVHSVSWLITRFHSVSCFCDSFLYVFITPLFLVFFSIYLSVSFFIFSFPSLVSFVILHSFRSSICLCLYLYVLFLSSFLPFPFSQHTNPCICIYFSSIFLAIHIFLFLLYFSFLLSIYLIYFWFLLSVIIFHSFYIWQRLLPIIYFFFKLRLFWPTFRSSVICINVRRVSFVR